MTQLQEQIMAIVDEIGDPLMEHFTSKINLPKEDIHQAVLDLVHDKTLRMKDDDIAHDWCYIRNI